MQDPIGWLIGANTTLPDAYDTPEERRNIIEQEIPAAGVLGEPVVLAALSDWEAIQERMRLPSAPTDARG